ncbi:MAG: radical SAM protein [Kiritimatiellae bacterium]|nr:radical SAM protein [Kiritimatiellia bacterium]
MAFKTFGCRLNLAESLEMEAAFEAAGHQVVPIPHPDCAIDPAFAPDWIIVRGCSVTARAQRDCEKEIARLSRQFPSAKIWRTGCLAGAETVPVTPVGTVPMTLGGTVPMATSRAYLKVQDGCSGRCAFCIVPQFRGPPVSVPFAHVLERARAFIATGYRELVVTGCNLSLYRDSGNGLPQLLAALAELSPAPGSSPVHRVRIGSIEPGICDDALVDAIAAHPNICPFLHISLQSASHSVLKRMNRPYTIDAVAHLCAEARRRIGPHFALGADVIAGFPGEAQSDFAATLSFLREIPFTHIHAFPFSERPGTPAASMPGAMPRAVRLERARELNLAARELNAAFARSFIGSTVEVCVEAGGLEGRTAEYLHCRLSTPAPRRSLAKTKVAGVDNAGNLIA